MTLRMELFYWVSQLVLKETCPADYAESGVLSSAL